MKASRGGWIFASRSSPNSKNKDPLGSTDLRELYERLSPNYSGRCTAPLLIDLKAKKIVSNESANIVRMLNSATFGKDSIGEVENDQRINLYALELTKLHSSIF